MGRGITNCTYSKEELLDMVYPVGSIYMSVADMSPETFFGGLWDRIEHRFLYGASGLEEYYTIAAGTDYYNNIELSGSPVSITSTDYQGVRVDSVVQIVINSIAYYTAIPYDAYAVGETGGSETVELLTEHMPKHGHIYMVSAGISSTTGVGATTGNSGSNVTGLTGGGDRQEGHSVPHNNMPPYLAVYMWKRTA